MRKSFGKDKHSYWRQLAKDSQKNARDECAKEFVRKIDFSVTLPQDLRTRVETFIKYEYDEDDRNAFIAKDLSPVPSARQAEFKFRNGTDDEVDSEWERIQRGKDENYNESTCSEIERLEIEFPVTNFFVDKPPVREEVKKKEVNWMSKYICKEREKRITWNSRLYKTQKDFAEKSGDEQAEILMDASAECFAAWMNDMGSEQADRYNVTKEQVNELFSVEVDATLSSSMQTDPRKVEAIAKTVADQWELPEMAIELKYDTMTKNQVAATRPAVLTHAFGRTISYKERPWVPTNIDEPITSVWPEHLLSYEKIFKGLGHLQSTKLLVEFYRTHAKIERPTYLMDMGQFEEHKRLTSEDIVPLYERLKLKY